MSAAQRVKLPVDRKVEDLLLWRDPAKSGAVLAGISIVYFLLEWSNFNVITVGANLGLLAVSGAFLWSVIANFAHRPGPPIPGVLREGVTEGQVKQFAADWTPYINKALAFAYRVATGKDVVLSIQVAGVLFVIAKIGGLFTPLGWVYTAVLLAFTVPKLYEVKKDEIDGGIAKAQGTSRQLYDQHLHKYVEKIPRAQNARSTPSVGGNNLGANNLGATNVGANNVGAKLDEFKSAVAGEMEPKKPVTTY